MGPGMAPNAGQPGTPGAGMPHQFAAGPMAGQVNPAMMGGMPPGANPNMQAFQHLTPTQQQQMFQQQQMHCKFETPTSRQPSLSLVANSSYSQ